MKFMVIEAVVCGIVGMVLVFLAACGMDTTTTLEMSDVKLLGIGGLFLATSLIEILKLKAIAEEME